MKERIALSHDFVKTIPEELEERTLYISMDYATVVHKCCCGCGQEVVTPLSPTDWRLTYNGESVTLFPSIGNWGFACRSHYWIENGTARWAEQWTTERIEAGRAADRRLKRGYYEAGQPVGTKQQRADTEQHEGGNVLGRIWSRLRGWWQR